MNGTSEPAPAAMPLKFLSARPRSSDLMGVLYELESRFPVGAWKVANVPLWPLLRLRWFFGEWARHYAATNGSATLAGLSARLRSMLKGSLVGARMRHEDSAGNDRGSTPRDLLFLSDGLSFARLGDRWVERFCDPIIAGAVRRGLTNALWTPLNTHTYPRLTPSLLLQSTIDLGNLAGALRSRLAPHDVSLPDHRGVLDWLAAAGFNTTALQAMKIQSDGARLLSVVSAYRRRLVKTNPRLAFVVSYYSLEGMAFVRACRDLGIPVIDVQHGVQGEFHPAYAAWPKPEEGRQHALLPDHFWVWSEWERKVIEGWSAGTGHSAIVGGNPWLDVWRPGSQWSGVAPALETARRMRMRSSGRPVVLVTLQFGLAAPEQIEPLCRLMGEACDRLVFWVRLHPAMLERREEIRARLNAGIRFELDACTDLPLHALLPVVDVHMTHSSSTVIEAAQFGVPSVLTTLYGAELFAPLLDSGSAVLETGDPTQLASTLLRLVDSRRDTAATMDPERSAMALDALLSGAPPHEHRGTA
jgi:hypothetical protein